MQPKKKSKSNEQVISWTQRIGVSFIGLLTALGAGLIMYTGVMAATYEQPEAENEFIVYDEGQDKNQVNQESSDQNSAANSEGETPATPTEDKETDHSVAYCNIDGVNVRKEAATGTEIIGNLNEGDEVTVLNRYYNDEWVQISFEGQTGYVYVEYLDFE